MSNELENYAEIAKEMFDYVAVCRRKHGLEQILQYLLRQRNSLQTSSCGTTATTVKSDFTQKDLAKASTSLRILRGGN